MVQDELPEGLAKSQMSKGGREVFNWQVEVSAKREVEERGGEVVYWFGEITSKSKVGDRGRERIN